MRMILIYLLFLFFLQCVTTITDNANMIIELIKSNVKPDIICKVFVSSFSLLKAGFFNNQALFSAPYVVGKLHSISDS